MGLRGSRVGPTRRAPAPVDPRTVRIAFASCQNINEGFQNAYRQCDGSEKAGPGA